MLVRRILIAIPIAIPKGVDDRPIFGTVMHAPSAFASGYGGQVGAPGNGGIALIPYPFPSF